MKKLCLLLITITALVSCEKSKFKGDDCNYDCHILSGQVFEFGTSNPIDQAEITITAKKKKHTKYIATTKTDQSGYWKISFDADYIENLKEGYIEIERKNYVFKKQRVYFYIDSVDINQQYEFFLHKTAEIYYSLNFENSDIKRVESRFDFENQGFKELKYTNKEVPSSLSFRHTIPANQDVNLKFFTSLEENASGDNEWLPVKGFPQIVNVPAYSADTVELWFH